MSSSLVIAPAVADDLPAILALVHAAYARNAALGFRFWGVNEPMDSLVEDFEEGSVWKALDRGRLVGSIRLKSKPEEGLLYVNRLCIDPASQRKGLGRELMEFAEEEAARRGLGKVRLDTAKPFTELVEWYRRQGYELVGETQFDTTNYRSVLLEKKISV